MDLEQRGSSTTGLSGVQRVLGRLPSTPEEIEKMRHRLPLRSSQLAAHQAGIGYVKGHKRQGKADQDEQAIPSDQR